MAAVRGKFPPKGQLPVTGPIDGVRDYYRPVVGPLLRRRVVWLEQALAGRTPAPLLEIGYGSGILLPSLAPFASQLYGVDVHAMAAEVERSLARVGVSASLVRASAEQLGPENAH